MAVDFDNDLLLVTAASGKQAASLLPHLTKWKRLRLAVLSEASRDRLKKRYPNAEVVRADITDAHACNELLKDVTACYLVTPAFSRHETQSGINVIDAALANIRAGGPFKHMLRSSVLHPVLRKLINHDNKRYIEEYLVESGVPYTTVQPSHMMETTDIGSVIDRNLSSLPRPFNPEVPFSFTCARDLGEASAIILEQREKHLYATYQLVSTPQPLTYVEVGRIISEELGRDFHWERITREEVIKKFVPVPASGKFEDVDFESTQAVARLFMYYDEKGLVGNSNVLEMILGRKPLGYREWVRLNIQERQK